MFSSGGILEGNKPQRVCNNVFSSEHWLEEWHPLQHPFIPLYPPHPLTLFMSLLLLPQSSLSLLSLLVFSSLLRLSLTFPTSTSPFSSVQSLSPLSPLWLRYPGPPSFPSRPQSSLLFFLTPLSLCIPSPLGPFPSSSLPLPSIPSPPHLSHSSPPHTLPARVNRVCPWYGVEIGEIQFLKCLVFAG